MRKSYPKIRLVLNIILLFLLFGSTYAYAMFQGGFVSWFLFYSVLFILLLSLIVILFPFSSLIVAREMNQRTFMSGEKMIVTIKITRRFLFPFIYLVVRDDTFEGIESTKLFFFSFNKDLSYSYEVDSLERGEYHFGSIEVRTGDFFGLFSKVKKFSLSDSILVYPKYQDLSNLGVFDYDKSQSLNNEQDLSGDVSSVSGVREYIPGDRLYSINWKVSARTNKLMTKEFEVNQGNSVYVVIDCVQPTEEFYAPLLFERAIEFTASIVRYSLQMKAMVGFAAAGDDVRSLPFQTGLQHQISIFSLLAKIEPSSDAKLNDALDHFLKSKSSGTTLIVISTSLTEDAVKKMHMIALQHVKIVYCLITNKEKVSEMQMVEELRKINVLTYVIQSDTFNDAIKAGEKHGR